MASLRHCRISFSLLCCDTSHIYKNTHNIALHRGARKATSSNRFESIRFKRKTLVVCHFVVGKKRYFSSACMHLFFLSFFIHSIPHSSLPFPSFICQALSDFPSEIVYTHQWCQSVLWNLIHTFPFQNFTSFTIYVCINIYIGGVTVCVYDCLYSCQFILFHFAHKLLDTCSHNVLIRFQSYFPTSPISHFNRTLSLK